MTTIAAIAVGVGICVLLVQLLVRWRREDELIDRLDLVGRELARADRQLIELSGGRTYDKARAEAIEAWKEAV